MRLLTARSPLLRHVAAAAQYGGGAAVRVGQLLDFNTAGLNAWPQVQLRKKFFPEWLTRVDVGAVYETNADEVKYVVGGKKSFELSDDGLLSLDLKASYRCVDTRMRREWITRGGGKVLPSAHMTI